MAEVETAEWVWGIEQNGKCGFRTPYAMKKQLLPMVTMSRILIAVACGTSSGGGRTIACGKGQRWGCLLFPLPLLFRLLLQLGIPPFEENEAAERNLPYALQCYEKTAGYVTTAMPAANWGVCIFTDGVRLWITHGLFNGWRRMRKRNMSHQRGIKRLKMPSGCTVLLM